MKRLGFDDEVTLSVALTQRIQYLIKQMATSSEQFKENYRKEIEQTQELLSTIYNSKIYTE